MESANTVTISIDEYFELRQRAEMNGMLMKELGELNGHMLNLEERLCKLEYDVHCKQL